MFSYNSSDNVIGVEIPNQIAENECSGSALSHVESAIREGLGIRADEALEDFVETVVTGAKEQATHLLTELALSDSDYTLADYQDARNNDNWDLVNELEDEEFRFNIVVDVAPINWQASQLEKSNEEFASKDERFNAAFKKAIKMRNRNLYDPERDNDKLGDTTIDKVVVISDGQTSSRSLVDDVMFNGTDVVAIAYNDIAHSDPTRTNNAMAPADD